MMFKWKLPFQDKSRPAGASSGVLDGRVNRAAAHAEPAGTGDEQALDAFVTVLRALGQHAFDLEQESAITFNQLCEAWARHLTVLAPPPMADATAAEAVEAPVGARDWPSVQQFVVTRRRREQEHVNKALSDLRQGLWALAQSLGTALIEEQRTDKRLKSQIDRLKAALDATSTEQLKNEVVSTAASLSQLVNERQQAQRQRLEELGARVADLAGQLREAKQEGTRDPLTQLINRRGLDEFLNRMVFMRDVFAETAVLLMIDVDHFKTVNDSFGHLGGDAVLKAIADCLVRNFPRKSDLVARYGGEEFAVVLPGTSLQNAVRLAERMRRSIRDLRVPYRGREISVTVSVGAAQLGRRESVQSWLERADQALFVAKARGRDCVVEADGGD